MYDEFTSTTNMNMYQLVADVIVGLLLSYLFHGFCT